MDYYFVWDEESKTAELVNKGDPPMDQDQIDKVKDYFGIVGIEQKYRQKLNNGC